MKEPTKALTDILNHKNEIYDKSSKELLRSATPIILRVVRNRILTRKDAVHLASSILAMIECADGECGEYSLEDLIHEEIEDDNEEDNMLDTDDSVATELAAIAKGLI